MSTTVTTNTAATDQSVRMPEGTTMQNAIKLAISEDKPILLDYWTASIDKSALVGVRETKEKLLVKSVEEYTSPIQKIYKTGADFIIMTENSIYLVCASIPTKRIAYIALSLFYSFLCFGTVAILSVIAFSIFQRRSYDKDSL